MPPIQLTRRERASLRKLQRRPRQLGEIPPDHQEKLANYGLVRKQVLLIYITPLGQLELLRQRFRDIRPPEPPSRTLLPPFRSRLLLTSQLHDPA
jgi:hypothetical protein